MPTVALFTFMFLSPLFTFAASNVVPLKVDIPVTGTTASATRAIVNPGRFTQHDFFESVGLGGQVVFEIDMGWATDDTLLDFSTCRGTNFDTHLLLLSQNPIGFTNANIIAESANDITCAVNVKYAFLSASVAPGVYYVLVTGHEREEGNFMLDVTRSATSRAALSWALDRIDQRWLPLDARYSVSHTARNRTIYVIDSGIRISHSEFEGRAEYGYDFVNDQLRADDCTGHGTHVAGIMAGRTFGVAKEARVVSVKVFGCSNTAQIVALFNALHWVLLDSKRRSLRASSIVALMFSTDKTPSRALDHVLHSLLRSGMPIVAPVGDNGQDACEFYPSSDPSVVKVGATDADDTKSSFSNWGKCVDLYAPGGGVRSAWHSSDEALRTVSGTTQAAAIVSAIASIFLEINGNVEAGRVKDIIRSLGTSDVVDDARTDGTAKLAFVRSVPLIVAVPARGYVYVLMVLNADVQSCSTEANELVLLRQALAEKIGVQLAAVFVQCALSALPGSVPPASTNIEVRIEFAEREAASGFAITDALLSQRKAEVEEAAGLKLSVKEAPWTVDAKGVIYWGVLSFTDSQSRQISRAAIAAICVGTLSFVVILGTVICVVYRYLSHADDVELMEESGNFGRGSIHFQDFDDDEEPRMPRSFRGAGPAMNFSGGDNVCDSSSTTSGGGGWMENNGMNRIASFMGGRPAGARGIVRLQSFGPEALAGIWPWRPERLSDNRRHRARGDARDASFRGNNNLVLNRSGSMVTMAGGGGRLGFAGCDATTMDAAAEEEVVRICSMDGEAFAMVGNLRRLNSEAGGGGSGGQGTGASEADTPSAAVHSLGEGSFMHVESLASTPVASVAGGDGLGGADHGDDKDAPAMFVEMFVAEPGGDSGGGGGGGVRQEGRGARGSGEGGARAT